ncbi:MAG: phosphoheptose isomerase [Bacteroidales bacterium]|nr:phosphoheptose isomerase [Bacteroidales bacterium]
MYNPFPYHDPKPVNRPELSKKTVESIVSGGNQAVAKRLMTELAPMVEKEGVIIAFDGYTTAKWDLMVSLLARECEVFGFKIEFVDSAVRTFKSGEEIDSIIDPLLIWDKRIDPTLLYGKVYHGGYIGLMDEAGVKAFREYVPGLKAPGKLVIVYGYGSLIKEFRGMYDVKCWLDITPMNSMLRIRAGEYANIGKKHTGIINRTIRRCYYCDFENAVQLRKELFSESAIDWYFLDNDRANLQMMPFGSFSEICAQLVKYPFRAKPCYLEGVWGGSYMKKQRGLPEKMRNAAWVFDFIPMEVSVLVDAGGEKLDINFCSFVHKEGVKLMGEDCVRKYKGYFPIRFNWDDSYHSTGNMSIQCHSGGKFNVENYNEFGRQDESYYVVVTGHEAKTFIGFRDDADIPAFFKEIEAADTDHVPCDYMKYVSYEESKPGLQVMLPAGTIHSSGRNQVILEIGSLTIGSYTYKMYDYLRLDFDGKQRPIHTHLGELNVRQDRRHSVIHDPESPEYIVQEPRLDVSGGGWSEYILGENPQMYISLRRLEFDKACEQDTRGEKFHVLTLVDGESIRIRSKEHPERFFDLDFMEIACVPASMGRYVIENLGKEPIRVHKTCLRDGYQNDPA